MPRRCSFLPSHQENFGIAVVEALACGKPALISDKVNIWREIVDDGAGMTATDTLEGTERMLTDWLSLSEAQRTAMSQRARCSFETRFQIDRATAALVEQLRRFGVKGLMNITIVQGAFLPGAAAAGRGGGEIVVRPRARVRAAGASRDVSFAAVRVVARTRRRSTGCIISACRASTRRVPC